MARTGCPAPRPRTRRRPPGLRSGSRSPPPPGSSCAWPSPFAPPTPRPAYGCDPLLASRIKFLYTSRHDAPLRPRHGPRDAVPDGGPPARPALAAARGRSWLRIAHRLAAGLPPSAAALPEGATRSWSCASSAREEFARLRRSVPRGARTPARGAAPPPGHPRPPDPGARALLGRRARRDLHPRPGMPQPRPRRDPGRRHPQGPRPHHRARAQAQAEPRPDRPRDPSPP